MSENIDHPTLKAIVKWKNYPSILALVSEHMAKSFFHFISKEDIFRKIKNLDNSKAVQKSDISVKTT